MNIQENITRFTDLENNDSLSAFMNHTAQQSHFAYGVFYNFIKETKPKRILEIGTALGGFTEFLFIIINELELDTKIISYDISERPWYSQMIDKGIDIRVENIFSHNWDSVKPEVEEFIKDDGTTIVLCDGGWHGEAESAEFSITTKDAIKYEPVSSVLVKINPKFYRPAEVDLLLGDSTKARTELSNSFILGLG